MLQKMDLSPTVETNVSVTGGIGVEHLKKMLKSKDNYGNIF